MSRQPVRNAAEKTDATKPAPIAGDGKSAQMWTGAARIDLLAVSKELEAARSRIEERFVEGGAALMSAHDIVTRLMEAIGGITGALDDEGCEEAARRLVATMSGLGDLVRTEQATGQRLRAILGDGEAIVPRIDDMQRSLRYLSVCAMETRVAGAGVPEFIQFADDVVKYVGSAAGQIGVFADKVGHLSREIATTVADDGKAGIASRVPAVSAQLDEALRAVRQRRAELRSLADNAAHVAAAVQARVGKVLSALQIGDVTRQRIEHVQTGIAILREQLDSCASARQAEGLAEVGTRLLAAQTSALIKDFVEQTRIVVGAIEGLAGDATRLLALTGKAGGNDGDPIRAIERGVGLARDVVRDIEQSGARNAAAHGATRRVATELLSNMGNIGNLRSVRDDIRCLAINAYLRSNRLGSEGRGVGVVAAEMNTYAARLGVAAEGILQSLSAMQATATTEDGEGTAVNLAGELDGALATLREAHGRTGHFLTEAAQNGHAVADRIGHIARDIDFRKDLGEHLETCRRLFGIGDERRGVSEDEDHAAFSERLFPVYTMAVERDVHRSILKVGAAGTGTTATAAATGDDLFDDLLF